MSGTPGSSTLTLVVAADRRGLDELKAAFAEMKASAVGVLTSVKDATAALSAGGVADLARMKAAIDETAGAVRVLQAENQVLTARINEVAAATKSQSAASAAARTEAVAAAQAQRDLSSAVRGAASAANVAFLSYGALVPLMASFAAVSATIASLKIGTEFQYQLQFVGAIADATQEQLKGAGDQFKQFALDSQFSATEVARGARTLVQAGVSLQDSIQILPQLLKFSTLGEIELAQGAEIATGTMHAFSLSVADIPHILDSTAKAAQISQTTISEMGSALRQASSVGQQFGVSVDQINAILAVLAERNIRGSSAGTALMNMFRSLDPTTAKGKQAFQELNIQIADSSGHFKDIIGLLQEYSTKFAQYDQISQARLAGGLFNNRGARAFLAAIAQANGDLQKFFDAATNSSGTLDTQFSKIADTVKVEGVEALHAFENAAIDAFTAAAPQLTDMARDVKAFATDPAIREGLTAMLQIFLMMAQAAAGLAGATVKIGSIVAQGAAQSGISHGLQTGVSLWGDARDFVTGFDPTRLDDPAAIAAARQARTQRQLQANLAAREAAGTNSFRASEAASLTDYNQGYGNFAHPPATEGDKHFDDSARKAAEQQAQAELQLMVAKYNEQERVEKAHYQAALADLKAYHSAGLIDDTTFSTQEQATLDAHQHYELQQADDLIAALQDKRTKVGADKKRQAAIDAEIDKASQDRARNIESYQRQAIDDAAQSWSAYNKQAKDVLDSAQKSDDLLVQQIADLTDFTSVKKDHVLQSLEAKQATEQETLARLENAAAVLSQTEMLTPKQAADLKEIEAIKARLPLYDQEIAKHKALTEQLKATQNDATVGAVLGLQKYLDTVASTASIMENAFKKGFSAMEDMLVTFVTTGKGSFKGLADSVISDIVRMIVKMEITVPLAQALRGALTGGGSGGVAGDAVAGGVVELGAANGAGQEAAGGVVNGLGNAAGSSLLSAGSSYLFGSAGTATAGGMIEGYTAGLIGEGGFAATIGTAASSLVGGGAALAEQIASFVPVIGWVVAIAALAYSVFGHKGGGPKSGGSATDAFDAAGTLTGHPLVPGTDNGRFYTPSNSDADLSPLIDQTGASYYAITRGLGGTANADTFGLGFDTDPNGTANTRVSSEVLGPDGKPIFSDVNRDVGKGTDQLSTELGLEAERDLVAALQNTHFDKHISDIFASIKDVSTASKTDLDAVIQKAQDMATVLHGIDQLKGWKGLSVESLQAMQQGSETLVQTFQRVGGQMADFDSNFETDAQKLTDAQTAISDGFKQLGIAEPQSKEQFYDLVHGLDLSTEAGRAMFTSLMQIAPAFLTVANAATSAASAMQQATAGFYSAAAGLTGGSFAGTNSIGSQFGQIGAKFNLDSAVQAWLSYSSFNTQNGQTVGSSEDWLSNALKTPGGINSILSYAQSFNDPQAIQLATAMIQAYGGYDQALHSSTDAVQKFSNAAGKANEALEAWANSKLLGSDSPLLPAQKLSIALDNYQQALSSKDKGKFQSAADDLLAAGKAEYASSPEYTALFNRVIADTQKLGGFKLNYTSDVQAASINQMRSDLVRELVAQRAQNTQLQSQVADLIRTIQETSKDTRDAIAQGALDTATRVGNAIASVVH